MAASLRRMSPQATENASGGAAAQATNGRPSSTAAPAANAAAAPCAMGNGGGTNIAIRVFC